MSEAVIKVRDLEKCYRIWSRARPTDLKERLHLVGAGMRARVGLGEQVSHRQEVWALRGISFDVFPGEVFGVIGPNGAGKSTLLSILARITEPTAGYAEIRGRAGSLLEVGTGFHPELTGRDNVFLNGAILGMSRAETARKFDEIVEFSGIADFIDIPVKRYSSGMQVRLAFAVAAQLEPEILLLDEVLAVGDAEFQARCHARVDEITRGGRTVLFVSHDVYSVARLCKRAIVLERGRVAFEGPADEAVERYLLEHRPPALDGDDSTLAREGTGEVRVRRIEVTHAGTGGRPRWGSRARIAVTLDVARPTRLDELRIDLAIKHPAGGVYVVLSTHFGDGDPLPRRIITEATTLVCEVDEVPLKPATYLLSAAVDRFGTPVDRFEAAGEFTLLPEQGSTPAPSPTAYPAPVLLRHRWLVLDGPVVTATIEHHAEGLPSARD